MPIYEYQCDACQHYFDAMQKMGEEPIKICPVCQQPSVKRLVSAAGFQLKGSGWYETDFKHKNKPATIETKQDKATGSTESKAVEGVSKESPPVSSSTKQGE